MELKARRIKVKVLIVGKTQVGKSSLLSRLIYDQFYLEHRPTIGLQKFQKKLFLKKNPCEIQFDFYDCQDSDNCEYHENYFFRKAAGIQYHFFYS